MSSSFIWKCHPETRPYFILRLKINFPSEVCWAILWLKIYKPNWESEFITGPVYQWLETSIWPNRKQMSLQMQTPLDWPYLFYIALCSLFYATLTYICWQSTWWIHRAVKRASNSICFTGDQVPFYFCEFHLYNEIIAIQNTSQKEVKRRLQQLLKQTSFENAMKATLLCSYVGATHGSSLTWSLWGL